MRTLTQPTSWGCGQACVAMALGISFDDACERMGHRGRTHSRHLLKVLTPVFPNACFERLKKNQDLPKTCIARMRWYHRPRQSHWIYMKDGELHDPAFGNYDERTATLIQKSGHFVSFISLGKNS